MIYRFLSILVISFLFGFSPVHAQTEEPPALRIGISVNAPPWEAGNFIRDTARYLQWKLPHFNFDIEFLNPSEIRAKVKEGKLDFIICSPLLLGSLNEPSIRVLGTIISREEKDPDRATGGAVLVKKSSPYSSLLDLKGKHISATAPDDFSSYIPIQSEISSLGEEPEKFFSKVDFEGLTEARRSLKKLLKGTVDAAIVRAGYLEERNKASGENLSEELKVIPVTPDSEAPFKTTGHRYPNEVFAACPNAPNKAVREVLTILLSKPTNGWGQHWSVAPDMSEVDSLLHNLKLGPFEYLRHWSPKRIWDEFRWQIIFAGFLLIFLALHSTLAELLVKKRTLQLRQSLEKLKNNQEKLIQQNNKIANLERNGIVGQLSTILAHEMKHHLAGIIHMNRALRRKIENELSEPNLNLENFSEVDEGLAEIDRQAKKAVEIIDHVRNYAKRRNVHSELVDLGDVVSQTVSDFRLVRHWEEPLHTNIQKGCLLNCKRIEVEILVLNLLKNATEAAVLTAKPFVSVSLINLGKKALLRVENNGVLLDDRRFDAMRQFAADTNKDSGLGLGLGIIQTLTEQMLAVVDIKRREDGGAIFEIEIPLTEALKSSEQSSTES